MILLAFVIALALQAIPAQAYGRTGWTAIYDGIWYATGYDTSPRLMRAFACKIDLQNPNVDIRVSPGNGGSPYDCTLQGTDAFLSSSGSKVAMNTCHWDVNTPSPYADVLGLLMCDGNLVSGPGGTWPGQLDFTSAKVPQFYSGGDYPVGTYDGFEVGDIILTNGVPTTWCPAVNPYSGVGLTADNRYLILVVVDGRQSGWSDGCCYAELGQWLLDFGAYNARHVDGGGSSCMVRQDIGVVNSPCYGYVRAVAASIGVYSVGVNHNPPYEFANELQGWYLGNGCTGMTWTDCCGWPGIMYFDQTGDDCYVYGPACSFVGASNEAIRVRVFPQGGTTSSHIMQIFWKTTAENYWDAAKSSTVSYTAQNEWAIVDIPVTSVKWTGQTINQIRLDTDQTNHSNRWIIDYIMRTTVGPAAPASAPVGTVTTSSIVWNWGNVTGETGFRLYDAASGGNQIGSTGADVLTLQENSLTANTSYTRYVSAYDGIGESARTQLPATVTLSVPPTTSTITCDKPVTTPQSTQTFTFTAVGGFGAGTISSYKYVWDKSSTHTWTGTEAVWNNGTKACLAATNGNWYLHVQGYNSAGIENGTLDLGPYVYNGVTQTWGPFEANRMLCIYKGGTVQHTRWFMRVGNMWPGADRAARILLGFDLSTAPPAALISSGTFKAYRAAAPDGDRWGDGATTNNPVSIYPITRAWSYSTSHLDWEVNQGYFDSYQATPSPPWSGIGFVGATYDTYDGTNAWTTQGGDYGSQIGTAQDCSSTNRGAWMSWDWTGSVDLTNGLLMRTATEGTLASRKNFEGGTLPQTYPVQPSSASLSDRICIPTLLLNYSLATPSYVAPGTITSTSIVWNWGNVNGETGFKLYDAPTGGNLIGSTGADGLTLTEDNLNPNTQYTRYIAAYSTFGGGFESGRTAMSATTLTSGVPAAPASAAVGTVTTTSIVWNWGNVSGETGFRVYDAATGGNLIGSTGADVLTLTESGRTANTSYTRYICAYNTYGESTRTQLPVTVTLSVAPTTSTLTCDKPVSTPQTTADFTFTAVGGFGAGTVSSYKYVWDQSSTHTWTGSETTWNSATKVCTATVSGNWYLHVKGYNSASVENGTLDMGPYVYSPSVPDIIVDNTAGVAVGTWSTSSGGYGTDYRWRSTSPSGTQTFTWTPNITVAGNYAVYGWWVASSNRSTVAPFTIHHTGGDSVVSMNQTINGSTFTYIGTYNFAVGTSGYIRLGCNVASGKVVVADAVKLVKQ